MSQGSFMIQLNENANDFFQINKNNLVYTTNGIYTVKIPDTEITLKLKKVDSFTEMYQLIWDE